jgi:hypothetical protein
MSWNWVDFPCSVNYWKGLQVKDLYCHDLGSYAWLIRRSLDWMIGFIYSLYTTLGTIGNYSPVAVLDMLLFTFTHALGSSVFTSRILATDLKQSQYHFKSHMKSFHSLIYSLPLFCKCQLNSNPLFPCSYPGRPVSRNSTHFNERPQLNSSL